MNMSPLRDLPGSGSDKLPAPAKAAAGRPWPVAEETPPWYQGGFNGFYGFVQTWDFPSVNVYMIQDYGITPFLITWKTDYKWQFSMTMLKIPEGISDHIRKAACSTCYPLMYNYSACFLARPFFGQPNVWPKGWWYRKTWIRARTKVMIGKAGFMI